MVQRLSLWVIVGCIFTSCQASLQKRQCVFQVTTGNRAKYLALGNVNGSIQVCENTQCCLGIFMVIDNQIKVDTLACNIGLNTCPDATCRPNTQFKGKVIRCDCNTDLCNHNLTWTASPQVADNTIYTGFIIGIVAFTLLCFAANLRSLIVKKNASTGNASDLCSCQTTKSSEIDIADVDMKLILAHGHFSTVWQGEYQRAAVAVKLISADWSHRFSAEKEIYALPLMTHPGIVHFLGTGQRPDRSCFIVLQLAEYGSLHSYLCEHTPTWMLSLKLCQSLSEGLSYLHSDLHRDDVHKPSVAHRDLSSSNVLVRADGSCVLCDFGCSTILRSCSREMEHNFEGYAQTGTLRYISPEILEGSVNLTSNLCLIQGDIYSLGLLLWEIWMRCSDLFQGGNVTLHLLPYEPELGPSVTRQELVQFVFHMQKRPTIPEHWARLPQGFELQELLADCWDCDPDARLTVPCVLDRLCSLKSCSLRL